MEVESAVRTVVRLGAAAVAALTLAACSIESADGGPEAGEASDGYFTSEDVNTVFIEEMTWTEVREAIDRGATTVILPTAGTEQNGPHMVTGKHRYIIEEASDRIARELGDALVAPTVTYVPEGGVDPPSGHMQYAGTITLPNEFFMKLVEYAARSFRAHGFTDIAFIGDSGGNQRGMEAVATMLNEGVGRRGIAGPLHRGLLREQRVPRLARRTGRGPRFDRRPRGHLRHLNSSLRRTEAHPAGQARAGRRVRGQRRVGQSYACLGRIRRGRDADARGRGGSADPGRARFAVATRRARWPPRGGRQRGRG